jgi:hypothetical protein
LDDDVRPARRLMLMPPVLGLAFFTLALAAAQPATSEPKTSITATNATITMVPDAAPAPSSARLTRVDGDIRVATKAAQSLDRDSTCSWDSNRGRSFNGNVSTTEVAGRTTIREQMGWRGTDRIIQRDFGDLRACMVAEGITDRADETRPGQWLDRAMRVVLETERRGVMQRLEIERQAGGPERRTWRVGGAERAFDGAARQWQSQTLAVLDTTWELSTFRGRVSSGSKLRSRR